MEKAKTFMNNQGRWFYVRIIEQGERYGGSRCLYEIPRHAATLTDCIAEAVPDSAAVWDNAKPGVIFYDFTYACRGSFGPMGQQVSTYYIETILEGNYGLNLHGGEPAWSIDKGTMHSVREWLLANAPTAKGASC